MKGIKIKYTICFVLNILKHFDTKDVNKCHYLNIVKQVPTEIVRRIILTTY